MEPIFLVNCPMKGQPNGDVYAVRKMNFTPELLQEFWTKASQFKTLFGVTLTSAEDLFEAVGIYLKEDGSGYTTNGLFWYITSTESDFLGVFYLTDINPGVNALAHYTFFDRRHHGRKPLARKMLKYLFEKYHFQRLSVEIPTYVRPQTKHFITECGFTYEGKKRKAAFYVDEWFDINQFGILKEEVLNGRA